MYMVVKNVFTKISILSSIMKYVCSVQNFFVSFNIMNVEKNKKLSGWWKQFNL